MTGASDVAALLPAAPAEVLQRCLLLVLSAVCVVAAVRCLLPWMRKYLLLKKVPGPDDTVPPLYLLLEYVNFMRTRPTSDFSHELCVGMSRLVEKFGRREDARGLTRVYVGFTPVVLVSSAEAAEALLSDTTVINKPHVYQLMNRWIGDSILPSGGESWRKIRKVWTPAFHAKALESFMSVFNAEANAMARMLRRKIDNGEADILLFHEVSKCTLDTLARAVLGCQLDTINGNDKYARKLSWVQFLMVARTFRPWLWWDRWYYHYTKEGKFVTRCLDFMHDVSRKIIHEHKAKCEEQRANPDSLYLENDDDFESAGLKKKMRTLMEILYEYHQKSPGTFDEERLRNEVDTLMFAGQDTTSTSLAFTLYLLGLYPEVQKRCREEIFCVVGENQIEPITTEHIAELSYLNACYQESMRMFPPLPLIGRHLEKDAKIYAPNKAGKNGITLPAHIDVYLSIFNIHRDSRYFPQPDKFLPERFLDPGAPHLKNVYSHMPFSAGPRKCIGYRFALMESKVILADFIRNFTWVSKRPLEELRLCFEIVIRAQGDLPITLQPYILENKMKSTTQ